MLKDCLDANAKRMATELNLNPDLYKKIGEIGKFEAKNPDGERGAGIFGGKGTKKKKNVFYIYFIEN